MRSLFFFFFLAPFALFCSLKSSPLSSWLISEPWTPIFVYLVLWEYWPLCWAYMPLSLIFLLSFPALRHAPIVNQQMTQRKEQHEIWGSPLGVSFPFGIWFCFVLFYLFCFVLFYLFYFILFYFWPHLKHMEVSGPRTESWPQLWPTPQLCGNVRSLTCCATVGTPPFGI